MGTMNLKMITPHSRYDTFHTPYIQVWIIDFFPHGMYKHGWWVRSDMHVGQVARASWFSCIAWVVRTTDAQQKAINQSMLNIYLELKGQGLNCRTICLPLKQWDFWSPLNRNSMIGDRFLLDEDLTNKFNTLLSQHYSSLLPPDVPTIFSQTLVIIPQFWGNCKTSL